jgi:hypothetical protein
MHKANCFSTPQLAPLTRNDTGARSYSPRSQPLRSNRGSRGLNIHVSCLKKYDREPSCGPQVAIRLHSQRINAINFFAGCQCHCRPTSLGNYFAFNEGEKGSLSCVVVFRHHYSSYSTVSDE